jgi:hypothetical protein
MTDVFEQAKRRARDADILDIARRHGVLSGLKKVGDEYVGPCPRCGGKDRFAINARKLGGTENQACSCAASARMAATPSISNNSSPAPGSRTPSKIWAALRSSRKIPPKLRGERAGGRSAVR